MIADSQGEKGEGTRNGEQSPSGAHQTQHMSWAAQARGAALEELAGLHCASLQHAIPCVDLD